MASISIPPAEPAAKLEAQDSTPAAASSSSTAPPASFDAELSQLLSILKISTEAQEFLSSLGANSLADLVVAVRYEDLTREILLQHGVQRVPAAKLMDAIDKVCRKNC